MRRQSEHTVQVDEPPIARFLFADTRMAWLWLIVRLYAGYMWLTEGWDKLHSAVWTGPSAGVALTGFVTGALKRRAACTPTSQDGMRASSTRSCCRTQRRGAT